MWVVTAYSIPLGGIAKNRYIVGISHERERAEEMANHEYIWKPHYKTEIVWYEPEESTEAEKLWLVSGLSETHGSLSSEEWRRRFKRNELPSLGATAKSPDQTASTVNSSSKLNALLDTELSSLFGTKPNNSQE